MEQQHADPQTNGAKKKRRRRRHRHRKPKDTAFIKPTVTSHTEAKSKGCIVSKVDEFATTLNYYRLPTGWFNGEFHPKVGLTYAEFVEQEKAKLLPIYVQEDQTKESNVHHKELLHQADSGGHIDDSYDTNPEDVVNPPSKWWFHDRFQVESEMTPTQTKAFRLSYYLHQRAKAKAESTSEASPTFQHEGNEQEFSKLVKCLLFAIPYHDFASPLLEMLDHATIGSLEVTCQVVFHLIRYGPLIKIWDLSKHEFLNCKLGKASLQKTEIEVPARHELQNSGSGPYISMHYSPVPPTEFSYRQHYFGAMSKMFKAVYLCSNKIRVLHLTNIPFLTQNIIEVFLCNLPFLKRLGIYDCPLMDIGSLLPLLQLFGSATRPADAVDILNPLPGVEVEMQSSWDRDLVMGQVTLDFRPAYRRGPDTRTRAGENGVFYDMNRYEFTQGITALYARAVVEGDRLGIDFLDKGCALRQWLGHIALHPGQATHIVDFAAHYLDWQRPQSGDGPPTEAAAKEQWAKFDLQLSHITKPNFFFDWRKQGPEIWAGAPEASKKGHYCKVCSFEYPAALFSGPGEIPRVACAACQLTMHLDADLADHHFGRLKKKINHIAQHLSGPDFKGARGHRQPEVSEMPAAPYNAVHTAATTHSDTDVLHLIADGETITADPLRPGFRYGPCMIRTTTLAAIVQNHDWQVGLDSPLGMYLANKDHIESVLRRRAALDNKIGYDGRSLDQATSKMDSFVTIRHVLDEQMKDVQAGGWKRHHDLIYTNDQKLGPLEDLMLRPSGQYPSFEAAHKDLVKRARIMRMGSNPVLQLIRVLENKLADLEEQITRLPHEEKVIHDKWFGFADNHYMLDLDHQRDHNIRHGDGTDFEFTVRKQRDFNKIREEEWEGSGRHGECPGIIDDKFAQNHDLFREIEHKGWERLQSYRMGDEEEDIP